MSQSSVSADMSQPQTVCRQSADCFYITMKYCDWLVIGGVTGWGRHKEWFVYRRYFFHVLIPPHASLLPAERKK